MTAKEIALDVIEYRPITSKRKTPFYAILVRTKGLDPDESFLFKCGGKRAALRTVEPNNVMEFFENIETSVGLLNFVDAGTPVIVNGKRLFLGE